MRSGYLPPGHWELLGSLADERAARALSQEPADWDEWAEAAEACYVCAGIRWPEQVIRVSSPLALERLMIQTYAPDAEPDPDVSVPSGIHDQVVVPLQECLARFREDTREELLGSLLTHPGWIADAFGQALRPLHGLWWRRIFGDWFDARETAVVDFLVNLVGVDIGPALSYRADFIDQANASVGLWWPEREFVIACDRPEQIVLEPGGDTGILPGEHLGALPWHGIRLTRDHVGRPRSRLHCCDGPALRWRDGAANWFWHGTRVPREVIEHPEAISVASIWREPNTEIRRVMLERYGLERFIHDAGAKVIAEDEWGRLWSMRYAPDESRPETPLRLVEMINSTAEPDGTHRTYFERVPPTITTPLEGLAWQADVPPEVYGEMVVQT